MKLCVLVWTLCFGCAAFPLLQSDVQGPVPLNGFPGWEAAPIPPGRVQRVLGPREQRFAHRFPGHVGVFTDGDRVWIVRWLARPTRLLHSAADCLRGAGYEVEPGSAWADAQGQLWSAFRAVSAQERYEVRERWIDSAGRTGTDVSAWYWSALLNRSEGPWWSVVEMRPEPGGSVPRG